MPAGAGKALFKLFGLLGMQGVEKVDNDLKKIDKQARKTQKEIERLGRHVSDVGKVLIKGFTAPLLIAGGVITKFGADFDRAMTRSTAIMGDLSDDMRKQMRTAAIDVSKVTKASATEAAEAYFFLASAGLDAAQSVAALPKVAKFAQAGAFDLARATDLLTDAQSALGLSSKDTETSMRNMTRVSDVLVKANTLANATVEQFSESLTNKAGAALRLLGKDIEEGAAVLAVYADQGLKGAAAGESLNIAMRDLQKASLNNKKAFEEARIKVFDAAGEMRNMADIIGDLENLLSGMSDEQRRAALTTLGFQEKSINATMALVGTSKAIRNYEKNLKSAAGTTDEVAKKQLQNFWDQLGLIKDRLIAVGLTLWEDFGGVLNNSVLPVLKKLVGLLETAANWWKNLDAQNKKTVGGFILIAASIGPVVFLIGKLITLSKILIPLLVALKTGTLSFSGAMAVLSKSVLGITLVIGALIALGWYWYSQWDTLSIQIKALWAKITLFIAKGVTSIAEAVADGFLVVLNIIDKVASVIPGFSEKIKNARIGVLRFKATMLKDLMKQQAYTNTINDQAEANENLSTTLKKAIVDGKKAIGIKEDDIKETKKQIDFNNKLSKEAEQTAKKRIQFEQDILDQTRKLGADKFELLAIEREQAIQEAEQLGADVLAVKKLYDAKEKELLAEDERVRQEFNQRTKDELNQLTLDKLELLDLERQESLLKAEELGADTLNIKRLYLLKEQQLKDQLRKEESEKDKAELQKRLRMTSNIGNKLDSVLSKFSDNKMKRLEIATQREIEGIKYSQLTDEQKELAIQKIEMDTERKRQKLERERAIREKAAALFNIAINTASAIVEALPNVPLSIIVGALGVAEGVAVATAPLPFQEGGLIEGSERGVAALVGEENQDELIFPLENGIGLFIDGLMERLSEIELPIFGAPALAGAGGPTTTVNLNIGTFIGDERGLKELERRLDTVRIAENQRKGF